MHKNRYNYLNLNLLIIFLSHLYPVEFLPCIQLVFLAVFGVIAAVLDDAMSWHQWLCLLAARVKHVGPQQTLPLYRMPKPCPPNKQLFFLYISLYTSLPPLSFLELRWLDLIDKCHRSFYKPAQDVIGLYNEKITVTPEKKTI